jgi:hypothetical protein
MLFVLYAKYIGNLKKKRMTWLQIYQSTRRSKLKLRVHELV